MRSTKTKGPSNGATQRLLHRHSQPTSSRAVVAAASERMQPNERATERANERTNERTNETKRDGRADETNERTRRTNERANERTSEQASERAKKRVAPSRLRVWINLVFWFSVRCETAMTSLAPFRLGSFETTTTTMDGIDHRGSRCCLLACLLACACVLACLLACVRACLLACVHGVSAFSASDVWPKCNAPRRRPCDPWDCCRRPGRGRLSA